MSTKPILLFPFIFQVSLKIHSEERNSKAFYQRLKVYDQIYHHLFIKYVVFQDSRPSEPHLPQKEDIHDAPRALAH